MRVFLILFLVAGLTLSCAQRKVTTPEAEKMPAAEEQAREGVTTPSEVKPVEEGPQRIGETEMAKVDTAEIEGPSRMKLTEEEIREVFKDIHFDYDKYDISDEDKPTLRSISEWLVGNPSAKLVIEGHCDDRGTNEYNLGLGDRRASAVKDYLISLGVSGGRMQTVSYGEESPLCREQTEECWEKNRRAHFVVIEGNK